MKKTKILCTIGPASIKSKVIKRMFKNGMNACRINTSYGDYNQYSRIIKNVRNNGVAPIILDTQGREVRILNEACEVKNGEVIDLKLSLNVYKKLKTGWRVLINDGLLTGKIIKVNKNGVSVKLDNNGSLLKYRNIIFKDKDLNLPVLSKNDYETLKYAVKKKVEFVAVSYTRNAGDLDFVRKKLKNSSIKVISKIEDKSGVKNYKSIIKASDAVMIARGDLGVEIPSEKIPLIQKKIIDECNKQGKPVIVATQMMESMISNNTPTRAETSDVANAILDGADCLMLSGETSIGNHPDLVVKTMKRICVNTENEDVKSDFETKSSSIVDNITNNAFKLSDELNARIICLTRSGYTARMISRFKPKKEVLTFTNNKMMRNQLMINYAIKPLFFKELDKYDVKKMTRECVKKRLIKKTDLIVFVAGLFIKNTTNTITVYKVNELLK